MANVPEKRARSDQAIGDSSSDVYEEFKLLLQVHADNQSAEIQQLQKSCQASSSELGQGLLGHLGKVVQDVKRVDARVDTLESSHNALGSKVETLEKNIETMQKQLVMAEQQAVSRDQIESDKFDRPPNNEVLRISSRKFVSKPAVEAAIEPWMASTCGFERGMWALGGGESGRNFTLRFHSTPLANARNVDKCIGSLKNDDGTFREFIAKRADATTEALRVDRDENPKSRTQRRMAACLLKVICNKHPGLPNVHTRKDNKKGRVSVFVDQEPICTMSPESPSIKMEDFLWNNDLVDEKKLDKQALIDEVLPMFMRPEDKVKWSL